MADQTQIVSAARFFFKTSAIPPTPISELKNINTAIEPVEYIYSHEKSGETIHTKQYGKTKPPQVTFVTGLDPTAMMALLTWHDKARAGDPTARQDTDINLMDAGKTFKLTYKLENAWCSKLDIAGAKSGATEQITITVTLECDKITCVRS
ncbi:MAG TPA: phage tail protein [Pseudonocardiaceae bacterium]|jgi:phage tail-like protein|nr:phage tail protein [Pseudonocardiaceae bacterium]